MIQGIYSLIKVQLESLGRYGARSQFGDLQHIPPHAHSGALKSLAGLYRLCRGRT